MNYWLFKKEPENISIEDIERKGVQNWHGVRNYQARNFMRDLMKVGDMVLVYHSNSEPSGVVGVARICSEAYDDITAYEPTSYHYDPKSTPEKPIWLQLDVEFVEKFPVVSLEEIRNTPELSEMLVLKRGMRLSLQSVRQAEFEMIVEMGRARR